MICSFLVSDEYAYFFSEATDLKHKERLQREISLKPYEECVGIYKGLRTSESDIVIALSLANGETLEMFFQRASANGANVLRELRDDLIGRKIGIMKVNDGKNTILIRKIIAEARSSNMARGGGNR